MDPTAFVNLQCMNFFQGTHTAREQIVLVPVVGRWTVANALPWVSVSVTYSNNINFYGILLNN